ncbi:hypothetical protein TNCV_3034031 [Trichonephila clavipes]|nr:hypothetical protein TNCV_3034031 [Trichonephila clavipes]
MQTRYFDLMFPYAVAINRIPLFSRMIMTDRISSSGGEMLKLKQYSVWNGQCALYRACLGHAIAARPRPPATVRDLEIA